MKARWRFLIALVVIAAALLAVNTVVLDGQTRQAAVDVEGAKIVTTSTASLQVLDQPAGGRGREGAPIVLLHCYGCSMRWWDRVGPLLNTGHRVVRVDLLGHGGSGKPGGGYSIDEQASSLAEALNKLGVQGATVVGQSLGGEIATALAERSSELVDRVVLLDSPAQRSDIADPVALRLTHTPVIGEALWRARFGSLLKSQYGRYFAPDFNLESAFENPDQVVADSDAMTYTSYEQTEKASKEFLDGQPLPSRLTGTGVPVLAIFGSEDQLLDVSAASTAFRTIPGATVQILEGVGASPNLEAPADVAERVLRFSGASLVGSGDSGRSAPAAGSGAKPKPMGKGKGKGGGGKGSRSKPAGGRKRGKASG